MTEQSARFGELRVVAEIGVDFERLERARRSAPRVPRRSVLALAIAGSVALAAGAGAATGLLPVGTIIPSEKESPPGEGRHVVVATGETKASGAWQLEAYSSGRLSDPQRGTVYQPVGLPCLSLRLVNPLEGVLAFGSGFCGEFPKSPGFSRSEHQVRTSDGSVVERLVYGQAPAQATKVVLTAADFRKETGLVDGPSASPGRYWLIAIGPNVKNGKVVWVDGDGRVGGRHDVAVPPRRGVGQ